MDKKIAICFSGQFRHVDKAIELLKNNLINVYACDIFAVLSPETYKRGGGEDVSESDKERVHSQLYEIFGKRLKKCIIVSDDYKMIDGNQNIVSVSKQFVKELWTINRTHFWEFSTGNFCNNVPVEKFKDSFKKCCDNDVFVHPKTKKEYLCNELKSEYEKENDFKYDIVLTTRLDIHIGNDTFKFEENPLPNAVYAHGIWECIFYSTSEVSDIENKKWNLIHDNMCNKYEYNSVGLDKKLLNTIYSKATGTGGVDVGLIYKWVINGLILKQIKTLNPNFKGSVFKSNEEIYTPRHIDKTGSSKLDLGGW